MSAPSGDLSAGPRAPVEAGDDRRARRIRLSGIPDASAVAESVPIAVEENSLVRRSLSLFNSGDWHDCEFIVGLDNHTQTFHAHRLLLASASEVFAAMLLGPMQERGSVRIPDISQYAFKIMLRFIYSGALEKELTFSTLEMVYGVADKYLVEDLRASCVERMKSKLNMITVFTAVKIALKNNIKQLEDACWSFISENSEYVLRSCSIHHTSKETIKLLLESDHLRVSDELTVFLMLLRWSTSACKERGLDNSPENQRSVLGELLGLVRFLTMNSTTFAGVPLESGVLTGDETLAVLANLARPGCMPLPGTICRAVDARPPPPHCGAHKRPFMSATAKREMRRRLFAQVQTTDD